MLYPLIAFTPVLLFVMMSDLRWMRIPNWTSVAAIGLFLVGVPLLGWDESLHRLVAAIAVFVLGFALFAVRIVAAGDVKILSALILLIPSQTLTLFGLVFSASMLLSIMLLVGLRATPMTLERSWLGLRAKSHMPMGVAIGLAGISHLILLSLA